MMNTEWLNVRLVRIFGIVALGAVAACAATPTDEPVQDQSASLASPGDETYIGDEGPGFGAPADDITKHPGFSIKPYEKVVADAPAKVQLNFTWKGQETGYWCGPGSTRIALTTVLAADKVPTQTQLATALGTTKDGTVRANVIPVLNSYINPATPYADYPVDTVPTDDQRALLKATIIARLAAGEPVIANVLSGWRPPGYPTGTIGHFVAVVGYDTTNDTVMIADPAGLGAPSPRWVNVPSSYWISLQNFGTWVGGRGIAG